MSNIIIYVSSRNNYDMLSGEVLKNINTEGFEFINVDDKSSPEEIEKGKKICQENDIVFLENESRDIFWALVPFKNHFELISLANDISSNSQDNWSPMLVHSTPVYWIFATARSETFYSPQCAYWHKAWGFN